MVNQLIRPFNFLIKALFQRANENDLLAKELLQKTGENIAKSTSGVIAELSFNQPINIILAGSVWAKATNDDMLNAFKKTILKLTNKQCHFIILKEPPVLGAILWALEIALKNLPSKALKQKVLESIIQYQQKVN